MRMRAVVGARERLKVSFWTVLLGLRTILRGPVTSRGSFSEEAGESNRVETPLLSRVQCTILASYYVLSPREALKYSPVVVDVNLPSIQLSVSPERINMALRVATQFTESAKKVADEAKRIKEQKKQRNDIASSQSDKILKSGDDDDDEKNYLFFKFTFFFLSGAQGYR